MDKDRINHTWEVYNHIARLVSEDEDGKDLLFDVVNAGDRYVSHCSKMEAKIRWARFNQETWEYHETTADLDRARKNYHNSLVSSFAAMQRYLRTKYKEQIPEEGLFVEPCEAPTKRRSIGNWAGNLMTAMYSSGLQGNVFADEQVAGNQQA